jgi:hypothetical protein
VACSLSQVRFAKVSVVSPPTSYSDLAQSLPLTRNAVLYALGTIVSLIGTGFLIGVRPVLFFFWVVSTGENSDNPDTQT